MHVQMRPFALPQPLPASRVNRHGVIAIAIAERIPSTRKGTVEIRLIVESPDLPSEK
jgi:hypothetical protein